MLMVVALFAAACAKRPLAPGGPRLDDDELLRVVRERPTPVALQSRFSIKMKSPKLGIVAPRLAGALIVERPTKAWIAVYDPVGSPVIQLASDGERVLFLVSRDREAVEQMGAGDALSEATGGRFGMHDVLDVVLGRLPLDRLDPKGRQETPEGIRYDFVGPDATSVRTWLDPVAGTPVRIEVDGKDGALALIATYGPFVPVDEAGLVLLPQGLVVEVPSLELTLDLIFKTWKPLEQAPDVFTPAVPEGYEVMDFEAYGERSRARRSEGAEAEAPPPE